MAGPPVGLCEDCRHRRVVANTRGSSFSLCERSRTDDRFPKYPRVPVVSCPGFERAAPAPAPRLSVRVGLTYAAYGEGPDGFWPFVTAAEEEGYDSLWLADSPALGGLATLPALAAVAARTEHLKLGMAVLVLPSRNPLSTARELATVDVLSGGRLLPAVGLGAGPPAELEALGIDRSERVARTEEAIVVIRALWGGEAVTHVGRFWTLRDIALTPRPANPKLELWLGGRAPAALRRIGRLGDGWLGSFVGPGEFAGMVDEIRAAAARAGRSIDEDHYGTTLFCAPSEEEMPAGLLRMLAAGRDLPRADHVAYGAGELRDLLWRFRETGATKFVVVPVGRDPVRWLRDLRETVAAFQDEA